MQMKQGWRDNVCGQAVALKYRAYYKIKAFGEERRRTTKLVTASAMKTEKTWNQQKSKAPSPEIHRMQGQKRWDVNMSGSCTKTMDRETTTQQEEDDTMTDKHFSIVT